MLSHVVYLERVFTTPMTRECYKTLQILARKFFWDKIKPRVAWTVLMQPRERAGLAVSNLQNYSWAGILTIWAQLMNPAFTATWKDMIFKRMGLGNDLRKLNCFDSFAPPPHRVSVLFLDSWGRLPIYSPMVPGGTGILN